MYFEFKIKNVIACFANSILFKSNSISYQFQNIRRFFKFKIIKFKFKKKTTFKLNQQLLTTITKNQLLLTTIETIN